MRYELELKLQSFARNLNIEHFEPLFIEYSKKYGIPNICFFSEILSNYPEILCSEFSNDTIEKRKNQLIEKINQFIYFLKTKDFTFNDSIVNKYNDEAINFFNLYDTIGLDYQNLDTGNTILHNQILGLNLDGVKMLLSNEEELIHIENNNGFCASQILFLENSLSYHFEESNLKKEKILKIIRDIENVDKPIYKFNQNDNLLHQTLKHQLFIENSINTKDIDIIMNVFNLTKLHLHLNLKFISEILDNDEVVIKNYNSLLTYYDIVI